jgi:hypothetical protein
MQHPDPGGEGDQPVRGAPGRHGCLTAGRCGGSAPTLPAPEGQGPERGRTSCVLDVKALIAGCPAREQQGPDPGARKCMVDLACAGLRAQR